MSTPAVLALIRARVPDVLALGAALSSCEFLRVFHIVAATEGASHLAIGAEALGTWVVLGAVIVAVISWCDAAALRGWRRWVLQTLLLAIALLATSAALSLTPLGTSQMATLGMAPGAGLFMYMAWMAAASAAVMSWYYHASQSAERTVQALRRTNLARQGAERRLLESRRQVLEARIDPQSLLHTLARVQERYADDASQGERALDDLIDSLHDASRRAAPLPDEPRRQRHG
jgi:hypothetical protein